MLCNRRDIIKKAMPKDTRYLKKQKGKFHREVAGYICWLMFDVICEANQHHTMFTDY